MIKVPCVQSGQKSGSSQCKSRFWTLMSKPSVLNKVTTYFQTESCAYLDEHYIKRILYAANPVRHKQRGFPTTRTEIKTLSHACQYAKIRKYAKKYYLYSVFQASITTSARRHHLFFRLRSAIIDQFRTGIFE